MLHDLSLQQKIAALAALANNLKAAAAALGEGDAQCAQRHGFAWLGVGTRPKAGTEKFAVKCAEDNYLIWRQHSDMLDGSCFVPVHSNYFSLLPD